MPSRPVALEGLVSELKRVEIWLTQSLGVATDNADTEEIRDPFAAPDDLDQLKVAIDRIRPLLWVYLTRQNEAKSANQPRQKYDSVRTLMEDTLSISDRYVRKNE